MTQAKHTPAPWTYKKFEPSQFHRNHSVYAGESYNAELVCDVQMPITYDSAGNDSDTMAEANARLIAAAPELLEALEKLRDEFRLNVRRCTDNTAWNNACAAITKAKGEV